MKCSNPLLLLSGLVASIGVNATLYKECNNNGQVSLIVDGFTKAEGPNLLKALQTNGINALVVLPQASLVGKENLEAAEDIKKAGHELGYRVLFPQGAITLATLKEKELSDELEGAKIRFKDLYKTDLRYVFFPYTTEVALEKRFGEIATKVGLVAVGHNFYLSPKAEQAKTEILSRIYGPQNVSYIVLVEGTVNQVETLKYYKDQIIKNKFTVVPMSKCLAGPKTNEKVTRVPIISGGGLPIKGSAIQKKTTKISNNSSKKTKGKSTKGKKFFINPDAIKRNKKISNKKIGSKNNNTKISGTATTGSIKRDTDAKKMQVNLDEAPKDKDNNSLIKIDKSTVKDSTNPTVKIDGESNKEDADKVSGAGKNSAASLGLSIGTLAVTIVAGLFAIL